MLRGGWIRHGLQRGICARDRAGADLPRAANARCHARGGSGRGNVALAFRAWPKLEGRSDEEVRAWLFTVARRQVGRYFRSARAEQRAVRRLGIQVPTVHEDDIELIEQRAGLSDAACRGRRTAGETGLRAARRGAPAGGGGASLPGGGDGARHLRAGRARPRVPRVARAAVGARNREEQRGATHMSDLHFARELGAEFERIERAGAGWVRAATLVVWRQPARADRSRRGRRGPGCDRGCRDCSRRHFAQARGDTIRRPASSRRRPDSLSAAEIAGSRPEPPLTVHR